jgi:hypothetical protein
MMRFLQRRQHLVHDARAARQLEGRLARDHLREIRPVQKLHRDVREIEALVAAAVEGFDQVRMADRRCRARLQLEAPHQLVVGHELVAQDLDRDHLAERELLGLINATHRARADALHEAEVIRDRATDEAVVGAGILNGARPAVFDEIHASPR